MTRQIGRYRILGSLGIGRLGRMYRALDAGSGRPVALRVVPVPAADDARGQAGLRTLQAAVRAAAQLENPHIAAIFEEGLAASDDLSTGPNVYITASTLVEGSTLAVKLQSNARPDEDVAQRWLTQMLLALDHAHARGIVHGDLKPANVLVGANNNIVITDFGLKSSNIYDLTEVGVAVTTPDYVSPEQLLGEMPTTQSDLYSAGVMFYQMLTGQRPFQGGAATVMQQMLTEKAPAPSTVVPALGTAYDGIAARSIARRPQKRIASAGQFLQELNRASFQRASQNTESTRVVQAPRAVARSASAPSVAPAAPVVRVPPAPPVAPVMPAARPGSALLSPPAALAPVRMAPIAPAPPLAAPPRVVPPRPVAPPSFSEPTQPNAPSLSDLNWRLNSAAPLMGVFTEVFGPMAQAMVQEALGSAETFEDALARLASLVPRESRRRILIEEARRRALLAPTAKPPWTSAPHDTRPGVRVSRGTPPGGGVIDPSTQAQAADRLCDDVGPMARILVGRASAKARTRAEFFRLLAQSIPDPRQRQAFLKHFGVGD
ncbi:MAG TPA: serine/threonine-protein kinase [Burkholderiaceae bacterium]